MTRVFKHYVPNAALLLGVLDFVLLLLAAPTGNREAEGPRAPFIGA